MRIPYCIGMLLLALGVVLLWAMSRFYIVDTSVNGFIIGWPIFTLLVTAWLCGARPANQYLQVSLKTATALWLSGFALLWWFYPWSLPLDLTIASAIGTLAAFAIVSFLSFCYHVAKKKLGREQPPAA